ncbi:MAG: S8 family serine peptidase [Chthoniobacterales bacterium]
MIGIIDTGMVHHKDLLDNMWSGSLTQEDVDNYGKNNEGINNLYYGYNALEKNFTLSDQSGHGTHVSGIAGAVGDNKIAGTGVAWRVQLMPCKAIIGHVEKKNRVDSAAAAEAIEFAHNHEATILNGSYSGNTPSQREFEALKGAQKKGVIAVVAAGNNSKEDHVPPEDYYARYQVEDPSHYYDNDFYPSYPACYGLDNIVTVAASDRNNQLSSHSHYGEETVHLAAPGEDILSTGEKRVRFLAYKKDVESNVLRSHDQIKEQFPRPDGYYIHTIGTSIKTGTSMAAPQVAGAFALMKARFSNLPYYKLINRLLKTTDPLQPSNQKIRFGRLNMARALSSDREYRTHNQDKVENINQLIELAQERNLQNDRSWQQAQQKAENALGYFDKAAAAFDKHQEEEGDSWDKAFESSLYAAQRLRSFEESKNLNVDVKENKDTDVFLSKKWKQMQKDQQEKLRTNVIKSAQTASEHFALAAEAFAQAVRDFEQDGDEDKKIEKEKKEGLPWDRAGMLALSAARHFAQEIEFIEQKSTLVANGLDKERIDKKIEFLLLIANSELKASQQLTDAINSYLGAKQSESRTSQDTMYQAAQKFESASECFIQSAQAYSVTQVYIIETDMKEKYLKKGEDVGKAAHVFAKTAKYIIEGHLEAAEQSEHASVCFIKAADAIEQDKTEARDSWHQAAESALKAAEQLASSESSESTDISRELKANARKYKTACQYFSMAATVYEKGKTREGAGWYQAGQEAFQKARELDDQQIGPTYQETGANEEKINTADSKITEEEKTNGSAGRSKKGKLPKCIVS